MFSLDKRLGLKAIARDVLHTDDYTPDQVITGRLHLNPNASKLAVIFPPWHGGLGWPYSHLAKRLVKRGYSVLAYSFHDQLLKPDIEQVLKSFSHLSDEAAAEIRRLVKEHSYEWVHLIGLSLGGISMVTTASKLKDFDQATFVTAGNLAKSTWNGTRTQHIRQELEAKGHSLAELEKRWNKLEPASHTNTFAGKPVLDVIALNDTFILTKEQQIFAEQLKAAGAQPQVVENSHGHLATIGNYCLAGKL